MTKLQNKRTSVQLPGELRLEIDGLARRFGCSRSALLVRSLRAGLPEVKASLVEAGLSELASACCAEASNG